ncbi:MAG TPA: LbtU family siderophore porin [Gammaproteobacteria bacterium]|jgi:hypothetical protein|nr:LbtU family siderophore porin [Gammaproteobacteria bacterium]
MKLQLKPLVCSLFLLGFCTSVNAAASSDADKIAALQANVAELQKQMASIKSQSTLPASSSAKKSTNKPKASSMANPTSIAAGNSEIEGPTDLPTTGPLYLPVDLDVPGQSFVSSGPYIGIPLEFSGGNLIVNSPSVNEDVTLLQIDLNVDQRLRAMGRPAESIGSHILLSGLVEGQALYRDGGGASPHTDIDLTSVNIDAYVLGPSPWTSGFIELSYDNNIGTDTGSFSSNDRMFNSRVFVNKAFVVLGDFEKSGFYSSFGQMFVPFGVYSTTLVSSPLTKILGRTPARVLVVGYKQQTPNSLLATGYIFNGPSHASSSSHINNGGINLAYTLVGTGDSPWSTTFGGGVIANLADSAGMQFTGNNNARPFPLFGGFGGPTETFTDPDTGLVTQEPTGDEHLVHRVPAYDVNLKFSMGNFQLIAEYITASTSFSVEDLTLNGEGARPDAMNLEGVYNMPWFVNPTSVSISYQSSRDALAIGLPAKRYSIVFNRSFWKNTLQSLEFRRDYDYHKNATSTGSNIESLTGTGKFANVVTLQFDYYF